MTMATLSRVEVRILRALRAHRDPVSIEVLRAALASTYPWYLRPWGTLAFHLDRLRHLGLVQARHLSTVYRLTSSGVALLDTGEVQP